MPNLGNMRAQQADLHFHALPGVDDGPATLDESLELLRAAQADGTTQIVATPHVRPDYVTDPGELAERTRELQSAAGAAGLGVSLRVGGELGHQMVGRLGQGDLDLIAQGPPRARWLLVEVPFEGAGQSFLEATAELRDRGFGVLSAHPERSADTELMVAAMRSELAAGGRAQVNAQSLTGHHGPEAQTAALRLIEHGLAAVVSSDAHGPARPPLMRAARRALRRHGLSPDVGRALTGSGPLTLLARGIRPAGRRTPVTQ